MLLQVLNLTQEQINGLPPTERDAIQALVLTSLHIGSLHLTSCNRAAQPIHERNHLMKILATYYACESSKGKGDFRVSLSVNAAPLVCTTRVTPS